MGDWHKKKISPIFMKCPDFACFNNLFFLNRYQGFHSSQVLMEKLMQFQLQAASSLQGFSGVGVLLTTCEQSYLAWRQGGTRTALDSIG
jgi:hypothetical protein